MTASGLSGKPLGNRSSAVARMIDIAIAGEFKVVSQVEKGKADSVSSRLNNSSNNLSIMLKPSSLAFGQRGNMARVKKSTGTIKMLTKGTAKKLAIGEIKAVCEKKNSKKGLSPKAIKKWTLNHCHLGVGKRCWLISRIMATAPKESQTPAVIMDVGSMIKINNAAMANNWL